MVFAAVAEDFNLDGADDLYLGRWNQPDLVLLNNGSGQFRQYSREFGLDDLDTDARDISQPNENTMGLGVGDLFENGYPDIFIGTGDPRREDPNILYRIGPNRRFVRCTELLMSSASSPYRTRGHGAAFAEVNHDGRTDLFVNLGGHVRWDVGHHRDSRQQGALYIRPAVESVSTATITL